MVSIDLSDAPFPVTRAIAQERHVANVAFMQGDLLAEGFSKIGQFDTVTALHVLEHFTEPDMYRVLANLLKVTTRRLILAVPFEAGEMEQAYGHQQPFTRSKLEDVGLWCLEQSGGGRMIYGDCAGGMMVIDVQS